MFGCGVEAARPYERARAKTRVRAWVPEGVFPLGSAGGCSSAAYLRAGGRRQKTHARGANPAATKYRPRDIRPRTHRRGGRMRTLSRRPTMSVDAAESKRARGLGGAPCAGGRTGDCGGVADEFE